MTLKVPLRSYSSLCACATFAALAASAKRSGKDFAAQFRVDPDASLLSIREVLLEDNVTWSLAVLSHLAKSLGVPVAGLSRAEVVEVLSVARDDRLSEIEVNRINSEDEADARALKLTNATLEAAEATEILLRPPPPLPDTYVEDRLRGLKEEALRSEVAAAEARKLALRAAAAKEKKRRRLEDKAATVRAAKRASAAARAGAVTPPRAAPIPSSVTAECAIANLAAASKVAKAKARLKAANKELAETKRRADAEADALFAAWMLDRDLASPPSRPVGDTGVPNPPMGRSADPLHPAPTARAAVAKAPTSPSGGSSDSDSDSARSISLRASPETTPGRPLGAADHLRRQTAGAGGLVANQVNPLAPSSKDMRGAILVDIERQRLIAHLRGIGPNDPRIHDHSVADRCRNELLLLVRSMHSPEFVAVEPKSGDELQCDIDYIDNNAQLPHLRIPLMRSSLVRSVPGSSEAEVRRADSDKRMGKFMKYAASEATRADSVHKMGHGLPPRSPGHPPFDHVRVVLGVRDRAPRVTRGNRVVMCTGCGYNGHFIDRCPDAGGGDGHNRRGHDDRRPRDRDHGGRGRGRGRGGPAEDHGNRLGG